MSALLPLSARARVRVRLCVRVRVCVCACVRVRACVRACVCALPVHVRACAREHACTREGAHLHGVSALACMRVATSGTAAAIRCLMTGFAGSAVRTPGSLPQPKWSTNSTLTR